MSNIKEYKIFDIDFYEGEIIGITLPEKIEFEVVDTEPAVKGNTKMSMDEVKALLDELMTLDNPYNCPHGRPTIIKMSKSELERKFKRLV